jgi:hypothetical protein
MVSCDSARDRTPHHSAAGARPDARSRLVEPGLVFIPTMDCGKEGRIGQTIMEVVSPLCKCQSYTTPLRILMKIGVVSSCDRQLKGRLARCLVSLRTASTLARLGRVKAESPSPDCSGPVVPLWVPGATTDETRSDNRRACPGFTPVTARLVVMGTLPTIPRAGQGQWGAGGISFPSKS